MSSLRPRSCGGGPGAWEQGRHRLRRRSGWCGPTGGRSQWCR